MTRYNPEDPDNKLYLRPRPVGFQMNTGVAVSDERVWFGAFYLQDQWTLNRLTVNGALRYDHAESRYGTTCIGPDVFVPDAARRQRLLVLGAGEGRPLQRHHPAMGRGMGRVRDRQDLGQVEHGQVPAGARPWAACTRTTMRPGARRTH